MTKETKNKQTSADVIQLRFDDNNLARSLFGPHGNHLKSLEDQLDVDINVRGGEVSIQGHEDSIRLVENLLTQLYSLLKKGYPILGHDIEQALKLLVDNKDAQINDLFLDSIFIPSKKKIISPRSIGQKQYIEAIRKYDLVFGVGPAGTGKTYLAMTMAVTAFIKGEVERIILTRPALEAGEKLGFLPGGLAEKVDPYLRPLYDALYDMLPYEKIQRLLERGEIEVAPLAFMRGRTLNAAFIILDEAQNCTKEQMKMFLTRMGARSQGVITGDMTQIDLPPEKESGLVHAIRVLKGVEGIYIHHMTDKDVVRHVLVQRIVQAYEAAYSNSLIERK